MNNKYQLTLSTKTTTDDKKSTNVVSSIMEFEPETSWFSIHFIDH